MAWRHPTAEDFDHQRDLRKHEPRPTDPPSRFDRKIPTAIEVAMLVRGLTNVTDAADLIEQYAKTVAAGARLEGVSQAYSRVDKVLTEAGR